MTEPVAAPAAQATVVFDLGGVLIDWDPRYLYRRLIPDPVEMEWFLAEICSPEWNRAQDAGRPWAEAIELLVAEHPAHEDLIRAYDTRWEETVGLALDGTVTVLSELRDAGVPLYALSNWSSDKFRLARPRFAFLEWFRGIVVSGDEGVVKPDPAIFRILFDRYGIDPARAVLVDDMEPNVQAAADLGMTALLFRDAATLRADLRRLGLPVSPA